jgi:epoxyqueuosine reductase
MATLTKPMKVIFHANGTPQDIFLPPQYYEDGLTEEMLLDEVKENIIQNSDARVELASKLHLKLLAVRSGLGRYGRNNICYVNGFGSFITLFALFTDYAFETDSWHEIQMMDICQKCRICLHHCPTGAIREENFVIAAGKCVTLYNEIEAEFPDWLPRDVHNALMGCTKCQIPCPANREPLKYTGRLEDITSRETSQFLSGHPDEKTMISVSEKLRMPHMVGSQKVYNIVRRNLNVLIS